MKTSPSDTPQSIASAVLARSKSSGKVINDLVGQYISAHGTGIPGGWSVKYPWSGGFIKAEGTPEEVVAHISATLRANNQEANDLQIAKWALQHVWLPRAGPHRWKTKFEASGSKVKALKATKPDKLTPREYGHVLWGLANLMMAMPPKERPMLTLQTWLDITTLVIESDSVGCDECTAHMREFLAKLPFMPDYTDDQLRVWLWTFHDNASQKAGNHRQPYNRVAKHWHWPALTDEEFNRIRKSL